MKSYKPNGQNFLVFYCKPTVYNCGPTNLLSVSLLHGFAPCRCTALLLRADLVVLFLKDCLR